MNVTYRPLDPATLDAFLAMHERAECGGCYCMYWHFEGDHRAWQAAVGEAEGNRESKRQRIVQGTTHGMVALVDERAVGSVQFERRDPLVRLTRRMPYRDLEPDTGTWALLCFRVIESYQGTGIARGLLRASIAHLKDVHGATAVEAYPRRGEDLRSEEVWTGPESLIAAEGFELVRDHVQYPVYRRILER